MDEHLLQLLEEAPRWLLRTLPAFAEIDEELIGQLNALADNLPNSVSDLGRLLSRAQHTNRYDSAANVANSLVWKVFPRFLEDRTKVENFVQYVLEHFPQAGISRVCRRLIVHPEWRGVGLWLRKESELIEVSIGRRNWGLATSEQWHQSPAGRRHAGSSKRRSEQGVPEIATIAQLRELLKIRSSAQLGFMLSAVADENGPYKRFEIEKRSGATRTICAPCSNLLWVQRRILNKILAKVPPNEAAHGFISGRSTATNAAQHVGKEFILKFDLRDFFPTISEKRVLGMFSSLGYHVGDGRYRCDGRSYNTAPVLARLVCCSEHRSQPGALPQGAPTSPAISNLICRRLDQRLGGLARKYGGAYTRYADDLTFSFDESIQVGRFRWWVDQLCFQEGFAVRQDKFRAIRRSQRQEVTGVVVNDRMNVPRRARRKFRAMLHHCEIYGLQEMENRQPGFAGYLRGFAAYINMVDPQDQGAMLRRVDVLIGESKP